MDYNKLKNKAKKTTAFLAYNANIDAIVRVERIKDIFTKEEFVRAKNKNPDKIRKKEDILAGILNSMEREGGLEIEATKEMEDWLRENLEPDEKRMGGQIGIMSNMLANLGVNCLVYFPLLSKEQSKMFVKKDNLKFLTEEGWKKSGFYFDGARTKTNWIFEFKKGEKIFDQEAKDSSRFIVASRLDEDRIKSSLLENRVKNINKKSNFAIVSGYHDVKEKYNDSNFLEQLKAGGNVLKKLEIPVKLEFGNILNKKIRNAILEYIASEVDCVSIDKKELFLILESIGEDLPKEKDIFWIEKSLKKIMEELDLQSIELHCLNYFIKLTHKSNKEKVERAFEIARDVAYLRSQGKEITWENLENLGKREVSEEGLREKKKLERELNEENIITIIVPNKINPNPKITVGLGDVFSASSFLFENILEEVG